SAADAIEERDRWVADMLAESDRHRQRLHSIIDAVSDGLLLYESHAGSIQLANPRCAELLGIERDHLVSLPADELQREVASRTDRPELYRERLEAHFAARGVYSDVLVLTAPERRVLRRSSVPIESRGATVGRVFTYTDVTLEANLDRMKSEFVSMASHELRTPLTSVHGALQLALAGSAERMLEE